MSLSQETMIELMAYADGELEDDARGRIEELLRTSDEARRVVGALGTLGDVVRDGADARAEAAGIDDVADAVIEKIERSAETSRGSQIVVPIARKSGRGQTIVGAVAVVLAIAAGAILVMRTGAPPPTSTAESTPRLVPLTGTSASPSGAPSAAVAEAEEPQGMDLVEVSSQQNKVDVFFVPHPTIAGAAASVVVWIDDRSSPAAGTK